MSRNRKIPTHWTTKIPKKIRNKIRNKIRIKEEEKEIKEKYEKACFPPRFVDSIIKNFGSKGSQARKEHPQEDKKPLILILREKRKNIKDFLGKIRDLTGNNYKFSILWQTKKIKTLFKIKDKITQKVNVIYKATSANKPEVSYIGETAQIAEQRWKQHEDSKHVGTVKIYARERK